MRHCACVRVADQLRDQQSRAVGNRRLRHRLLPRCRASQQNAQLPLATPLLRHDRPQVVNTYTPFTRSSNHQANIEQTPSKHRANVEKTSSKHQANIEQTSRKVK